MVWILKRVLVSILLVWIAASVVFLSIRLVPGDPAELLLSTGSGAPDPAAVAALRTQLGLDRPLARQYVHDLAALLHGDFGVSLEDGSPVAEAIGLRLPRTLELIAAAALIAVLTGIPAGLLAALRPRGWFDRAALRCSAAGLAVPVFVAGTLLMLLFAQTLHLLPAGGHVPFARNPGRHFASIAMPALSIGLGLAASLFRATRSSVLDVAQRDYIRTARAKGLPERRIAFAHILRTALNPVLTVLALQLGSLLGGTVLVEYVFNYPGLSGLLIDAVNARDYPQVQGVVLVISVLFAVLNLAVDLLHGVLDPRVRRT